MFHCFPDIYSTGSILQMDCITFRNKRDTGMNENFIRQTLACVSPLDTYVSNQPCVWFYRANFSKSIELKTRKKRRNKTIKFQCKETISLCKPFKQPKTYYFHDTNKAKTELNGSLTYQPHIHTHKESECERVNEDLKKRHYLCRVQRSTLNLMRT